VSTYFRWTPIRSGLSNCGSVSLTIALISQKGGVGKTTLAIHLATAFVAGGYHTLLLDLDPQASAAEWKDSRTSETPPVLAVPPARLPKVIEEAKKIGTEVLIIDTAPHREGTALDSPPSPSGIPPQAGL
jgi:chromosome partitioning protein